jgi:anti-sigma factor ChrR (cupin superfamily)
MKRLCEDPSGKLAPLTKMDPGAVLPDHRHAGLEQSFVIEGALVDEDGTCTAGTFVWRRAGSVHRAWSPDGPGGRAGRPGCQVLGTFDTPNEFL